MDFRGFHSSLSSSSQSSISNLHTLGIGDEEWKIAEKKTDEILSMVQPTVASERRRKEIIEYIQTIIEASCGIKVTPFGSVPLKTYLPDGDIDLTALCHHDEEVLSSVFFNILQNEEESKQRIQVRDVHCIPAEVKVVKCYVENVSVDISFNQMGGLCTLSFLEQVDQLIGEDHLFKRSVILTKAWCFYESRLLGANYGLISTYALEMMVIHIFNLFHSSLHCPLAVLCKFLRYYSTFDWEKYCLAINGLVLLSSLPEIVVQSPDDSDDLLLTNGFLQSCREMYSLSTGMIQTGKYSFHTKFLNIMDPLKDNNNLGRSVNKANFYRIKCALSYGSQKLRETLNLPCENLTDGIERFFKTTIERISIRGRPDVVLEPEPVEGSCGVPETLDVDEDLLIGTQYGLWHHDSGMIQFCSDPMSPQMQGKFSSSDHEYHDQNAAFEVNDGLASSVAFPHSDNVAKAATIGEKPKSRGTGTYIPQPVCNSRKNYGQSRRKRIFQCSSPYTKDCSVDELQLLRPKKDGNSSNDDSGTSFLNSSIADISLKEFPPLPQLKSPGKTTNPARMPPSSHKAEKVVVASSESTKTPTSPPSKDIAAVNTPVPTKAEKYKQIQQSPEINQEEVEEAKPAQLGDMNEFPALAGRRLRVPNELPPWALKPSEKGTDGNEGKCKGAWKEPLARKLAQKVAGGSKEKDKGAWKKPLVWNSAQKDSDGMKDESKSAAEKEPLVRKPAQKC